MQYLAEGLLLPVLPVLPVPVRSPLWWGRRHIKPCPLAIFLAC